MIRWGIIGAGNMAKNFAATIKEVENAKLVAISSSQNNKLELFGDEFKIEPRLRFSKYESIAKCDEINAIYISTLNNTHLDLIKICAINKKNILCEKPFCLNLVEATEIRNIIEENGVKFFEAIAYLSHPQTNQIFNLIDSNEIGEVNSIVSTFGFKVRKIKPESRLFNKKLGGGAILDVGCYPLSFIYLFNKNQNEIEFKDIKGKICKTNVDIEASANIIINKKINCEIKVSFQKNFENSSIIYGSKGYMVINQPWLPEKKTYLEIFTQTRSFKIFVKSDLSVYANQIKNVSNEFLGKNNNTLKLFDISKSFENMFYLDHWIKNISI
jgi:predicted dehydrogenase